MNSIQESTNELNAAIRYAESAITSAKQTIESMQFRQDMAKKQYTEQTGREQGLLKKLEVMTDKYDKMKGYADRLLDENGELEERNDELKTNMALMTDDLEKPTMPVIPRDVALAIFHEGARTDGWKASDSVTRILKGLCEREGFECRIHGIDNNPTT